MQREELREIIATDVRAQAVTYAEGIHEQMTRAMVDGMNAAAAENWNDDLDETEVRDVILPAMKMYVYDRIAQLATEAKTGWAVVYHEGIRKLP